MKKSNFSTIILILIFVTGMSLLLYPLIANWYNTRLFSSGIVVYSEAVANVEGSRLDDILAEAEKYNLRHLNTGNTFGNYSEEFLREYNSQLNFDGSDYSMMGYLSIPCLKISLPIYHTTDESVLSAGVGHIEGTSLPVGGTGTHAVLSSHRGLPSARLFTDLDQLKSGDEFILEIMGRTLTYSVDQINIVLPEELSLLSIDPNEDYCTLVTCTPYGVNTHRLLVRGRRVENDVMHNIRVTADALQIRPAQVAPFVAAPMLLLLLVMLLVDSGRKKHTYYPGEGDETR